MGNDGLVATGFYSLATSGTAAALSSAFGGTNHLPIENGIYQVRAMMIRAIGENANYTLDGTTPTTATTGGMPLNTADTSPMWIWGLANVLRFQAVATTSTGSIAVVFFN